MINRDLIPEAHPHILESPGYVLVLRRGIEDVDRESDVARIALEALHRFSAGFCRPLTIEISSVYWDRENDLPILGVEPRYPKRTLRAAEPGCDMNISPIWIDEKVFISNQMASPDISRFVLDAIADDGSGMTTCCDSIWVTSSMARLPFGCKLNDNGSMTVQDRAWLVDHPTVVRDGHRWVCGPLDITSNAPVEFIVNRQFAELSLRIGIHWSLWGPGGSGFSEIEDRVSALLAQGWELDEVA
ncbi:hypothetical protein [Nocardia sp. NPDC052566]|uniref:hypothetical protein n=1 Tax=Nocardia sp. NPDC052566 TaxID=3364330 RepID=UPI0037C55BFF